MWRIKYKTLTLQEVLIMAYMNLLESNQQLGKTILPLTADSQALKRCERTKTAA